MVRRKRLSMIRGNLTVYVNILEVFLDGTSIYEFKI
jgi:hypothetical protein